MEAELDSYFRLAERLGAGPDWQESALVLEFDKDCARELSVLESVMLSASTVSLDGCG